ncbi:hypothetical protein [Acrocarpospora catenulata]|uniref:hypothetical protein n=1 Tax=Acrocarpospora catenulata TaxID=2836182 RepID=UPI001BDB384A|nr:hypothetical protein [Acrocarpospora catenulata]
MTEETRIALLNYDCLIRERGLDDVVLALDSDTLAFGNGGVVIDELCRPGFTSATADPASYRKPVSDGDPWASL